MKSCFTDNVVSNIAEEFGFTEFEAELKEILQHGEAVHIEWQNFCCNVEEAGDDVAYLKKLLSKSKANKKTKSKSCKEYRKLKFPDMCNKGNVSSLWSELDAKLKQELVVSLHYSGAKCLRGVHNLEEIYFVNEKNYPAINTKEIVNYVDQFLADLVYAVNEYIWLYARQPGSQGKGKSNKESETVYTSVLREFADVLEPLWRKVKNTKFIYSDRQYLYKNEQEKSPADFLCACAKFLNTSYTEANCKNVLSSKFKKKWG